MNYFDAVVSLFYSDLYFRVYALISIISLFLLFVALIIQKVLEKIAYRKSNKEILRLAYMLGGMPTFSMYCLLRILEKANELYGRNFVTNFSFPVVQQNSEELEVKKACSHSCSDEHFISNEQRPSGGTFGSEDKLE